MNDFRLRRCGSSLPRSTHAWHCCFSHHCLERKVFGVCVCKVIFEHLPQTLWSFSILPKLNGRMFLFVFFGGGGGILIFLLFTSKSKITIQMNGHVPIIGIWWTFGIFRKSRKVLAFILSKAVKINILCLKDPPQISNRVKPGESFY